MVVAEGTAAVEGADSTAAVEADFMEAEVDSAAVEGADSMAVAADSTAATVAESVVAMAVEGAATPTVFVAAMEEGTVTAAVGDGDEDGVTAAGDMDSAGDTADGLGPTGLDGTTATRTGRDTLTIPVTRTIRPILLIPTTLAIPMVRTIAEYPDTARQRMRLTLHRPRQERPSLRH